MTLFIKDSYSILFLHVPKCGGSSIDRLFKENGYSSALEMRGLPPQDCLVASPQHQTSQNLKSMINMNNLDEIFIMVRNPYKRIISEFNWQFRDTERYSMPEINSWITESLEKASRDSSYSDNHFRACIDFIDADLPCNIFKLEDGMEFVAEYFVREHGSINQINMPNEKDAKSFSNSIREPNLNAAAIAAINQFYKYDFEAFGYKPIDSSVDAGFLGADREDENLVKEEKIKEIRRWREQTINTLYDKAKKELGALHTNIDQISNSINNAGCHEEFNHDEIQKSVESRFDEILVKLKYSHLNLTLLEASEQSIRPSDITNVIQLADEYRYQSRLKISLSSIEESIEE